MGQVIFDCGCSFPILGTDDEIHADHHEGMLPLGIDIDIYNVPTTCSRTWNFLSQGRTKGIFQLESHLGKTWVMKIKPENREELGALGALLRPGCLGAMSTAHVTFNSHTTFTVHTDRGHRQVMASPGEEHEIVSSRKNKKHDTVDLEFPTGSRFEGKTTLDNHCCTVKPAKSMTQHYKDRKHLLEDIEYAHELLEPILKSTYGVLTYQEQSMQIAVTLAGFDLQQADILRKAIGKKKADIMAEVKETFMVGCTEQAIVSREKAEEIFGWIEKSQRYSFNKSHAMSYGEGGYWTAYLKSHFPHQFYCSYLDGAQWKQDTSEEVYELVNDAKLAGITIAVPNFKDKQEKPYLDGEIVRFGVEDIKGVGAAALKKFREQVVASEDRLGKPTGEWDWLDYLMEFAPNISSTLNEALISCGALDYLQKSRTSMLYEYKQLKKLTKKEIAWMHTNGPFGNFLEALRRCSPTKKEGGGCHTAKRSSIVMDLVSILASPPHSLHDTADFIAWSEAHYLGTSITCSRVDGCEDAIEANAACLDVVNGSANGYIVLAVEVIKVKEIKTRKGKTPGKKMAFITVSDSTCGIDDVVVFPKIWREFSSLLTEGNTVLVRGELGRGKSFKVAKVVQI